MRVKRLEVQGFKSFKDKTVIHFDHSITGIVGPNGCGKSNIVDAFFWVMGEQSYKHMRGSGSDDLIFNGSSKYSPLGLAEATLVLETDAPTDTANLPAGATAQDLPIHLRSKEISVTRRVFRSGEGEYLINGIPSRLKDIKELFMDTGVGAKGYSVIEQGQIGKIVNSKPEERRLLIEEAAGIAKYKARKTESLRKIEATHLNLARLNDIIQEIERSLASLERQAQKAKQYKKYKEELLDKEMTWGRRKTKLLAQKLDSLKTERDLLEIELVTFKTELLSTENGVEVDRLNVLNDTQLAEELQANLSRQQNELTRNQSSLDLSRRRQSDLTSQLETLERERQELQATIIAELEKIQAQETGSTQSQAELAQALAAGLELEEKTRLHRRDTEDFKRVVDQAKRDLMNGVSQSSDLAARAAELSSRAQSAREQAGRLKAQVELQAAKVDAAISEEVRLREQQEVLVQTRAELQAQVQSQAADLQSCEQDVKAREKARTEADRAITQLKSRLQSLEELAAAHEGFGDGPKAALDWAKSNGEGPTLRALADSLQVKAGYEAALEACLDGRLESLISDSPGVALRALDVLHSAKQGRACVQISQSTHGVADSLSWEQVQNLLREAGFEILGQLTEFVEASDPTSARWISRVAVVQSLDPVVALIASGAVLSDWSITGLDGKSYDATGLLRGGSTESDHATSVLGRKRTISDLWIKSQDLETGFATIESELKDRQTQQEESRERLHALKSELQDLNIRMAGIDRDVIQSNRALNEARSQHELLTAELQELLEDSEQAEADGKATQELMSATVIRRAELEAQIGQDEIRYLEYESGLKQKDLALQEIRVKEASLRERAQSLRRELEGGKSLLADRERRLTEVERTLSRATQEHEEHSGGDQGLEEQIHGLTQAIHQTQSEWSAAKDRLEISSGKVNTALNRIKELHSVGNDKSTQSNQLAIEAERMTGELSFLIQNLEEKYGQGCLENPETSPIQDEMSEPVITREMTAEEEILLGEEVERIRERIRRLGEVNVMAIEEYEELKKRYDYLLAEKSDLDTSIKNLQEAIEHINKTSEERFRKAFTAIADRFERLFPIIFGGGSASLTLVYPEGSTDILEAGVDIMAQPPGKKVSNITLLSGGEKALTAVSLIFSIFMVKPSPFCVLDEVDAPLDDANIGKFNALLREMSVKSQFIVITHNKKTMELNDTLYGVTMEEPGVSKMVSIEMH